MAGGVDPNVTFNGFPPDLQALVDQANLRRQMAQAMQQRFATPQMPVSGGPVASRMSPLEPLLSALGSYMAGKNIKSSTEDIANVGKQYQQQVQGERDSVASLPMAEQITKLLGSMNPANRAYAEGLGQQSQRAASITHMQNEDVNAAAKTDIEKGQLAETTRANLSNESYRTAYLGHLDSQLQEAIRHNKTDEVARLQGLKLEAQKVGISQQELGVKRYGVGLDPTTGQPPDLSSRIDDILSYKRPPPGGGMQPNSPRLQAQMDQIYEEAARRGQTFNPNQFANKNKATLEFLPTAPGGIQLRSFANVDQHLGMLQDLSDAMHKGDVNLINQARVAWQKATGQPAPTNFDAVKMLVSGELQKSMAVHGGGETERKDFLAPIQTANAPDVVAGAIRNYRGVLKVQKDNLLSQARAQGVPEQYLTVGAPEGESSILIPSPPSRTR
jgi:hypothetical protein